MVLFWEVIIASLELAGLLIFLYLSLPSSLTVCPWLCKLLAALQHTNNISHFSCWRFPPTVCYLQPTAGLFTCWVALDDGLVVHLEGGITPAAGEAHYVVLAIAHEDRWLIYGDVISAHIEDDTDFSLLL